MANYIPPKKGLDPTPQTGGPPPSYRLDGHDAGSPGSVEAVDRVSAVVGAFVSAQRQNVANSVIDIHRAALDHPDVGVSYQSQFGRETITVTPRVQTSAAPAETPAVDAPNDLVDLAQEPQTPGPPPPLYLMVLYGKDSIAAIPMDALAQPAPDYEGTAAKSQWTQAAGGILPTNQLKLGSTEFLMLPLDLTGQVSAGSMMLSTTLLGDAVTTVAPVNALPLMNGVPLNLYTVGGLFSVQTGKLKLVVPPATDGSGYVVPHAISAQGQCYYFPEIRGSITVTLDPTSMAAYGPGTLEAAAQDGVTRSQKDALSIPTYLYALAINRLIEVTRTSKFIGGSYHEEDNYTATLDVISQGPYPLKNSVSGYSFYGVAPLSQTPALTNLKVAVAVVAETSYDLASNGFQAVQSPGGNTAMSNVFPLCDFDQAQGSDVLSVDMGQVTALQREINKTTIDMTGIGYANLGGYFARFPFLYNEQGLGPLKSKSYTQTIVCSDPALYPPAPDQPWTQDIIDRYYADLITALMALPSSVGRITKVMEPLQVAFDQDASNPPTDKGQFEGPPDHVDLSNYLNLYFLGSVSQGGNQISTIILNPYSCENAPLRYPEKTKTTINCEVDIFKERLTYTYDSDDTVTLTYPQLMTVHAFPPMLKGAAYYTLTDDLQMVSVVTPYAVHPDVGAAAYTPWIHVSNGQHVIQGYRIDGKGYAFLDGSRTDWLGALAIALKCQRGDIVTMVMDVTLDKIKAVAHVKPSGYS